MLCLLFYRLQWHFIQRRWRTNFFGVRTFAGNSEKSGRQICIKNTYARFELQQYQVRTIGNPFNQNIYAFRFLLALAQNRDLKFLLNFKVLHTLILDSNTSLSEKTMPFMPSLRILWLNKCGITNLPKWIHRLKVCTPNLRQLSLMGNPGSLSLLNGGSVLENNDYL